MHKRVWHSLTNHSASTAQHKHGDTWYLQQPLPGLPPLLLVEDRRRFHHFRQPLRLRRTHAAFIVAAVIAVL
jgi:hypothetical protein